MTDPKVRHPRCPYCHDEVLPADAKEACHGCMSWQHAACWTELGKCASCQQPRGEAGAAGHGGRGALVYYTFRSSWNSWTSLFEEAATHAGSVGPERLVSISHSEDQNDGVVTVWYWDGPSAASRRVGFDVFKSAWSSWDALYKDAAAFATQRGPDAVIGISHSSDQNEGVVTVWYWR